MLTGASSTNTSKKTKAISFLLKLSILCLGFDEAGTGALTPAISDLMAVFGAQYGATLVQMTSVLPQVCLVVVAPIFGLVANRFKRRHLALFGLICFTVGGFLPRLMGGLPFILACRLVLGVGVAVLMPLALVLIDDFFEGSEKNTMVGLNMTMTMIGGTFFQLMGGFLCTLGWRNTFDAYLYPVWIIILVLFFIPEPPKREVEEAKLFQKSKDGSSHNRGALGIIFLFCGVYILYHICFVNLPSNLSILIADQGFGNSATSGVVLSFMTVGAFLAGIIFGFIYKRIKAYTMILGMAEIVVGFALCFFSMNIVVVCIGCLFAGFGTGTVMPTIMSRGMEIAPKTHVTLTLSLLPAAMGLGQFLSPIVTNSILGIFGLSVGRDAMGVAVIMALVVMAAMLAFNSYANKKAAPVAAEKTEE